MTDISEDDIRIRAYALWEAAGYPDGTHEEHWEQALQQLTEEADTAAADLQPKAAKTSKLSVVKNDAVIEPATKKRAKLA